ncbi:hypothetical protein [Microbacterium sp.]|uniref:hypothetical protein n=1 Tax=Actinomycetes TaxID=1760 RepID=UPI0037C69C0D
MKKPSDLGPRGARLWAAITDDLEGDQHDAELVLETCRVLDVIDGLAAAVRADGVTVAGSRGQTVVHPAVQEMRQQQLTFARLLGQLNLDEAEVGAMLTARQAAARRAGQAKWRKLQEVRRGSA